MFSDLNYVIELSILVPQKIRRSVFPEKKINFIRRFIFFHGNFKKKDINLQNTVPALIERRNCVKKAFFSSEVIPLLSYESDRKSY